MSSPQKPRQPLYQKSPDGSDVLLLSPVAVLLLSVDTLYDPLSVPYGRRNAERVTNAFLDTAQANGYTKRDIFCTVAAKRQPTNRLVDMAYEVIDFIPVDKISTVLAQLSVEIPNE